MSIMRVRGLLIDLDGTLYVDDVPVEGATEAIDRLRRAGIPLLYITNTTRRPRSEVAAGLSRMGFPVALEEIFTPAVAASSILAGRRCHLLLPEALVEDLEGVETVEETPSD